MISLPIFIGLALSVAPPSGDVAFVHRSFLPPARPAVPVAAGRARNPIDRFVLAPLEAKGLAASPEASREVLARRLSFDLTGLPPTPARLAAFFADRRPDAYERLADEYLASPAFGERWATHWLDVARFAETNGYEADGERRQSWRYRDWVAAALNADLPYDRFVLAQLAGDLLSDDVLPRHDRLVAVGFNRCGPVHMVSGNVDPLEVRHEFLNEMTAGLGSAFLGLTLSCARCHDHKFDPISQREYFRFEAFFGAAQMRKHDLATPAEKRRHLAATAEHAAKVAAARAKIDAIDGPIRNRLRDAKKAALPAETRAALDTPAAKRTPAQKKLADDAGAILKVTWDEVVAGVPESAREKRAEFRRQWHALNAAWPEVAEAWSVEEKGEAKSHLLKRGNYKNRGKELRPGFPDVLASAGGPERPDRVGLAKWLTRPDHPLTARVIVNRLWQHHFGRGIVRTPNDFGVKGDAPTHPELLDWLATELVSSGWSMKHIHRLIVTSATYRQSSRPDDNPAAAKADPDNVGLWRMNRTRLTAEALRDATLAVSGRLTARLGGPSVRVPLEPEVYDLIFTEDEPDGLWAETADDREHDRRSLYLLNKRNVRLPQLEAFDQPDTLSSCPVRPVSTFAPQALIMLNGPFAQEQSRRFATRLLREAANDGERVSLAYRLALGREPRPAEAKTAREFIESQSAFLGERLRARRTVALPEDVPAGVEPERAGAWADFCLALLNANGFAHVE